VKEISIDVQGLRQQNNIKDMANLSLRKEIEYHQGLFNEQQAISQDHYDSLLKVRDQQMGLGKDLDQQGNRLSILHTEKENNQARVESI